MGERRKERDKGTELERERSCVSCGRISINHLFQEFRKFLFGDDFMLILAFKDLCSLFLIFLKTVLVFYLVLAAVKQPSLDAYVGWSLPSPPVVNWV